MLKQRLIERACEAGATGDLGGLLRDAEDLRQIEVDTDILVMADRFQDEYGPSTVAGMMAKLCPPKSIWMETVFADEGERVGFLCMGVGAGALDLYVASMESGELVQVQPVAGQRKLTTWRPMIDWSKIAEGMWTPGPAWRRQAQAWLDGHFETRDLEPDLGWLARAEGSYGMFSAFVAIAILHSPLFESDSMSAGA